MSDKIPNRYNWIFSDNNDCVGGLLIEDKKSIIRYYTLDALRKVMTMFKYTKLPKFMPKKTLEWFILGGYARVFRYKNEWYCGFGGMYGVEKGNYQPPFAIVNNVGINYYEDLKIAYDYNADEINENNIEDYCFIIPNDDLYQGLHDAIRIYAEMQTECLLTLKYILYNNRIPVTAYAPNDDVKASFDEFYKNIVNGKMFQSINAMSMLDGLKGMENVVFNQHTTNQLKDVIECMQYLKASFENSIGLNANYNMKRESLNDDEIALNDDNLLPTIDNMYESRKKAFELLNKCANEKIIEFELNSSWKLRKQEIKVEIEQQQSQVDNTSQDESNGGENNE